MFRKLLGVLSVTALLAVPASAESADKDDLTNLTAAIKELTSTLKAQKRPPLYVAAATVCSPGTDCSTESKNLCGELGYAKAKALGVNPGNANIGIAASSASVICFD